MSLTTAFKQFFKNDQVPKKLGQDQAWSDDSALYGSKDFPKYNPDELIGRKGADIYNKMMLDEQIKAVVHFKRDAVTGRQYGFQFNENTDLSEEDQKLRIQVFEQAIDRINGKFLDVLNGIMSSMYNGFSMTEKIYQLIEVDGKSWVGIKRLALKPFDTFEFYVDEFGNLLQIIQQVGSKEIKIDLDKFLRHVHNPDMDELYGRSELREAYRAWFSKDLIIKYQNIFLGRYASGFVWAELEEGFAINPNSTAYTTLQNVLTNIQATTAIIMPAGVKLHVEQPKTTDAYERAISQYDKAIAKALLVPNLLGISEQGDTGSYSQSQTQLEAFFWTLDQDASRLEETLNDSLFSQLGNLNWGDGKYPQFKFKPISQTMKLLVAKQWMEILNGSGAKQTEEDERYLRDMLGFPARTEDSKVLEPLQTIPHVPEDSSSLPQAPVAAPPNLPDETVVGEQIVEASAFSKAQARVDFAAIDRNAELITGNQSLQLTDIIESGIEKILQDIPEQYDLKIVSKIKFPSEVIRKTKENVKKAMLDGWRTGETQSKMELIKAERIAKKTYSKKIQMDRLADNALKYLDIQSFVIAGKLTNDIAAIIKREVLSGVKYSKSLSDVKKAVYEALASKGILSSETIEGLLPGSDLAKADYMLSTIIRTATFEAINEARFNYFTDDEVKGFVQAFEYSAILDSRTTEICRQLDNDIHSVDWPGWDQYRPPNHYNCRSLLVPITIVDEWTESKEPNVTPQEGFK